MLESTRRIAAHIVQTHVLHHSKYFTFASLLFGDAPKESRVYTNWITKYIMLELV